MGYYDNEKNVKEYMAMAEGYDGKALIEVLKKYLAKGATLLEIGMGPGKDLDLLRAFYDATGSDNSQVFLDLYKVKNKHAHVILLDAKTIDTDKKFDCIYSNKVLHHLTVEELKKSLQRQKAVLNDNGLLFHSFWYGSKTEKYHGLRFTYYTEARLRKVIGNDFEIIEIERYKEMEDDDSIYALLKKQG